MAFNLLLAFTIIHMHKTLSSVASLILKNDSQQTWGFRIITGEGTWKVRKQWSRNFCCHSSPIKTNSWGPAMCHTAKIIEIVKRRIEYWIILFWGEGKREIFWREDNENSLIDKIYFKKLCFPVDTKYRPNNNIKQGPRQTHRTSGAPPHTVAALTMLFHLTLIHIRKSYDYSILQVRKLRRKSLHNLSKVTQLGNKGRRTKTSNVSHSMVCI